MRKTIKMDSRTKTTPTTPYRMGGATGELLRERGSQLGLRLRSLQPEARPLETVPCQGKSQINYLSSLLLLRTTKSTRKQLDSVETVPPVFSF